MSTTPSRDQELKRGSPLWLFSSTNAWRAAAQQAFANFSGWHSAARVGVLQAFINGSKRLLIFGFQVFVRSEVRTLQLKLAGFSHVQSVLPQSVGTLSLGDPLTDLRRAAGRPPEPARQADTALRASRSTR